MGRRYFLGLSLALLLCTVAVNGAFAQGQGGGGGRRGGQGGFGGGRGGMGGGGLQMLRIAEVQKELKMTPEEIAKLDDKEQSVRQSMMEAFQGGGNPGDMSAEDRQKLMEKMQDIQTKAVADILDETQQKRYHQLELQQQGGSALANKTVADELKLTDDQKTKITDIQKQAADDRRAAMQGVNFRDMTQEDRTKMMTKMQADQKATSEKMIAVLTDDQKKQWKEMQGTPFTFPAQTNQNQQRRQRPAGA